MKPKSAFIEEIIREKVNGNFSNALATCREALKSYDSTELWQLIAELGGDYKVAVENTKWDISRSHLVWNKFINANPSKDLFIERLQHPHLDIDNTLQLYSQFVSSSKGDYEHEMTEAVKLAEKTKKRLQNRQVWELQLVKSKSVSTFKDYLNWESDLDLKGGLFARAVDSFPECSELWLDFIEFVWLEKCDTPEELLDRALVHAPSDELYAIASLFNHKNGNTSRENLEAKACAIMEQVYSDQLGIDVTLQQLADLAGHTVERVGEWMEIVVTCMSFIDKEYAETFASAHWKPNTQTLIHWLSWRKMCFVADMNAYCAEVMKLDHATAAEEQLKVFIYLGMPRELQQRKRAIRLSQSRHEPEQAPDQNYPAPKRARERTSVVAVGGSKEEILAVLGNCKIVSHEESGNMHSIELESEQEKKKALALVEMSRSREKHSVYAYDSHNTTIWLTNYPSEWTSEDIKRECSAYGQVLSVRLPQTHGRRFCYVQFSRAEHVVAALEQIGAPLVARLSDPEARKDRTGPIEEARQVYVSGLDFNTEPAVLETYITQQSIFEPESVRVPRSSHPSRQNDGYALVVFNSSTQAMEATGHYATLELAGRKLRASISRKKRRVENQHALYLDNVFDAKELQAVVETGQVKYNAETHEATVLFENEQQVARAALQLAGKQISGHTVRVQNHAKRIKPRGLM